MGFTAHVAPPIKTTALRPVKFRFGPMHIRDFKNTVQHFTVHPQRITKIQKLIVPRFGSFFEIERVEIGGRLSLWAQPMPCHVLQENSEFSVLPAETIQYGQSISVKASRAQGACRLNLTLREGFEACADFPESWRDVEPASLRRLHPSSPRQTGELELVYDWSWPIPLWTVARLADLEKAVGEELEEQEVDQALLENLVFDAFILGVELED